MLSTRASVKTLGICILAVGAAAFENTGSVRTASAPLLEVGRTKIPFDFQGKRLPKWSGGALVVADDKNPALSTIHTFGKDGYLLSSTPFAIPESSRVRIASFARSSDGTLAVVGSAYTADSRGSLYLAAISPDGQRQQIIRLKPFAPFEVAISSDGTYWVAGRELVDGREVNPSHKVIRRYSASDGEIGAYIPRSSLTSYRHGHPAHDSFLVPSGDRVGWYSNIAREYIEFSLDGLVLTRVAGLPLDLPDRVTGLALCDDGRVFASVTRIVKTPVAWEVFNLDRTSGTWKVVPVTGDFAAGGIGTLYGCDGNDLVTRTSWPYLRWLRQRAEQ